MITLTSPQQLTAFEVLSTSDDAKLKMVTAVVRTNLDERVLLLWLGDAYDTAGAKGDGQYTQADIEARAAELLSVP